MKVVMQKDLFYFPSSFSMPSICISYARRRPWAGVFQLLVIKNELNEGSLVG